MSTYRGIDIAHHQGNPDFKRVKAVGIDYVMIKATEGVNYRHRRCGHCSSAICHWQ